MTTQQWTDAELIECLRDELRIAGDVATINIEERKRLEADLAAAKADLDEMQSVASSVAVDAVYTEDDLRMTIIEKDAELTAANAVITIRDETILRLFRETNELRNKLAAANAEIARLRKDTLEHYANHIDCIEEALADKEAK